MKNLTILLLLAVTLAVTVNAGRNRKHRADAHEDEVAENNEGIPDWPSLDQVINHFEVPEEFLPGGSHNDDAEEHDRVQSSGNNHKKSSTHGRSHSHG